MLRAHEFEPSALPQFAALAPAARARLLDVAMVHAVSAGTVIFDQGESPTFQQVVLSGSVHLFGRSSENREVLIGVVEPPDFVVPAATPVASPWLPGVFEIEAVAAFDDDQVTCVVTFCVEPSL